jgi:hypothetical protein
MGAASEKLSYVSAPLNYIDANGQADRRVVAIGNARELADPSLDREGFMLARRASAVKDFYDPDEVRSVYYPEVERLLKDVTGATRAFVFEHDVRCAPRAKQDPAVRGPVRMIHDDYTTKSSPERIRLYLPDEAEELLRHRYAVINVWRAIRGPVEATPLAVCKASSVDDSDLIPTEKGVKHEVYLLRFAESHRWFYFPRMERDEALIFKCYDAAEDVRGRCTAHSAFDDPTTPANALARESIEVRAFVFYRPAAGRPARNE